VADDRFGRIALQTYTNEAYTLVLIIPVRIMAPHRLGPRTGLWGRLNFACTEFYEVHGPEERPPDRCAPASCMLRYFCNVTGRRSDTLLSSAPLKKGEWG